MELPELDFIQDDGQEHTTACTQERNGWEDVVFMVEELPRERGE